ncbi:MAG: peptidase S58 family protein [Alphaproteobacteria bacterium]|nr:MAG: peptidase S58 family protein [Alphaproteobacteria bacterium]
MTAAGVGRRNLITDVAGLRVGHAEDWAVITGTTVVLADQPVAAAVDVRGGGPGTRETDLLGPGTLVDRIDAIVLSGGSAFGLDAAGGAMEALAAQGRGFAIADQRVPIIPAAILFDLANGGDKAVRPLPYRGLGAAAVAAAGDSFALGSVGAGAGAKAGRIKGGLGSASYRWGGWTVGALAAVNSLGSVTVPGSRAFWARPFEVAGEFGAVDWPAGPVRLDDWSASAPLVAGNTTIAVVATDAQLDKDGCRRLAVMAQDGLARAIRPAHTPFDGDVVFAVATGHAPPPSPAELARLGSLAADTLARAIARGVYHATSAGRFRAWSDLQANS